MRRLLPFLALLLLMTAVSCAPLEAEKEGLVDFTDIPAEWGHLVTVTKYKDSDYYELWFSNPETGAVTHVPLYRPTWQIKLERVQTIERGGTLSALLSAAGGES
jgi:hypothetical protein